MKGGRRQRREINRNMKRRGMLTERAREREEKASEERNSEGGRKLERETDEHREGE